MIFKPTISLLIPCYNAEHYIEKFITNLSAVHGRFDEIIFYDDGSKDNTYQILLQMGYRVIQGLKNMGPGFSRNRLADLASSDYLHFHDIDDGFSQDFLEQFIKQNSEYPADVILGQADWIDANSQQLLIAWRYDSGALQNMPLEYLINNPLGIINTFYRRNIFLSIGGFNETIKCWEDADLHVRLAAARVTFSVIDSVIAIGHRNNAGISNNQLWCWECRLKFLEQYLERYLQDVNRDVFRVELKKIQTTYINSGKYRQIGQLLELNNKYDLGMDIRNATIIYRLSKFMPNIIMHHCLKLYRRTNR